MKIDYKIEKAQSSELGQIKILLEDNGLLFDGTENNLENFWVAKASRQRRGSPPAAGKVVGCAGMEIYGRNFLLRSFVVHPEHRNSYIALNLYKKVLQAAKDKNLKKAYLLTLTIGDYVGKFGFKEINREEVDKEVSESVEFKADCCKKARVFVREL